tara:strand:+ start:475 stop:768 length:294 start_codon:yes stop_codon:yes gene_type:complete
MGFEKTVNIRIQEEFADEGRDYQPRLEWFNGTLYADVDIREDALLIQLVIESMTGTKVIKSLLKATKTEPWDQWAFDITDEKLEGTWSEFAEEGLMI